MFDEAHLAAEIFRRAAGRERFVVAVAGPPGAGKSTLAERLAELLGESAAVVPMDGFHLDNSVLAARGLSARKGAPETFDLAGFEALLARLRSPGAEIAIPVFDRQADLARAGARIVSPSTRFVVVEGNYLLLDEAPWDRLHTAFDWTIFLDAPRGRLAHRLVQRWIDHGLSPEAARERAFANDMVNVERVISNRRDCDVVIEFGD